MMFTSGFNTKTDKLPNFVGFSYDQLQDQSDYSYEFIAEYQKSDYKEHLENKAENITEEKLATIQKLQEIADGRNQSLAQLALSWVLRENKVTSVLIGASRKSQIDDNVQIIRHLEFTTDELNAIEKVLN